LEVNLQKVGAIKRRVALMYVCRMPLLCDKHDTIKDIDRMNYTNRSCRSFSRKKNLDTLDRVYKQVGKYDDHYWEEGS